MEPTNPRVHAGRSAAHPLVVPTKTQVVCRLSNFAMNYQLPVRDGRPGPGAGLTLLQVVLRAVGVDPPDLG